MTFNKLVDARVEEIIPLITFNKLLSDYLKKTSTRSKFLKLLGLDYPKQKKMKMKK